MSPRRRQPAPGGGYTLVALVVVVAVMSILVAAALPHWSNLIRRDKEAELIFRGLQYAEAIRVFQLRFNRPPNTLDELLEVNPRSIRRLWKDPMTRSGEWQPIYAGTAGAGGAGGDQQGRDLAGASAPGGLAVGEQRETGLVGGRRLGPILGVRSTSEETSLRTFNGASKYSEWLFTAELIPTPVVLPDTLLAPRPTSDWIGKAFREGLEPRQGGGPRNLGAPRQQQDDDG